MNKTPPPGPLLIDIEGASLTAVDRELLAHPAVGGAILFARNYVDIEQLAGLTAAMRAVRPNLLIVADQEGGRVQRFRAGFTRLAPMRALGQLALGTGIDTARHSARELGWLLATELALVGVDMPLAPVVDLDYGISGVIGDRAFAADAATTIELAGAVMAGFVAAGSAATAKHFPGHGFVTADSHHELPVDERDRQAMRDDMAPYAALIQNGLASVMMAHVYYPQIDRLPASLSPRWIDGVLRDEFGFDGCVFCDDLSMGGAAAFGDYRQRAYRAQTAGCDYLPVCNNRAAVITLLDDVDTTHGVARKRRESLTAVCRGARADLDRRRVEADERWRAARALNETLGNNDVTGIGI